MKSPIRPSKYQRARYAFRTIKSKHRLLVFCDLTEFPPSRETVDTCMERCARGGISCVVPRLPRDLTPSPDLIGQVSAMYGLFLEAAQRHGVALGLHLDEKLERAYYLSLDEADAIATRTRMLYRREYYCDPTEQINLPLRTGKLMALVAYDEEHSDRIDLRAHVRDGVLNYRVPEGNWIIEEYICSPTPHIEGDMPHPRCNILCPTASETFLEGLFEKLGDPLVSELGKTVTKLFVSDVCFHAPNRRNWDESFNEVFISRFGFDPAPYYPALYHHIGECDPHIKSLFMDCRAEMLRSGILTALRTFSDRHGLQLVASMAEPKLPACSWLGGDVLASGLFSPAAVQEKAYLYGMNSTHIAASAADNYGSKHVSCEILRDYARTSPDIACKDAMNAFGHGANQIIAHLSDRDLIAPLPRLARRPFFSPALKPTFSPFVARVQTLLRGGNRVNDMAMLYPIYALHDKVYLYESPVREHSFEYPTTPFSCNYMTVLSSISTYAGQDITVLHPHVVETACHTEGGILYLKNQYQTQKFKVIILPGADMVSLDNLRLIAKFFDEGGKIIATGSLPRLAFEYKEGEDIPDPNDFFGTMDYGTPNDREVRALTRHIFGDEALNPSVVRDFFRNRNENGGEAFYISPYQTAADGTELTNCAYLNDALQSFGVALDVYMPEMPRFENLGALNTSYNEFTCLGLSDFVPGGGMISHIHKQHEHLDVFYFANTTSYAYDHSIYLRGIHRPEHWDPHSGRTHRLSAHYVMYRGHVYTRVALHLPPDHSVFMVSESDPRLIAAVEASADRLPDMTGDLHMMVHSGISRFSH
jgi:hypothetical protein